jgi:hypothetical protein
MLSTGTSVACMRYVPAACAPSISRSENRLPNVIELGHAFLAPSRRFRGHYAAFFRNVTIIRVTQTSSALCATPHHSPGKRSPRLVAVWPAFPTQQL